MGSEELVAQRERSLLSPAVRGDRAQLEALLHPDFVEIGASGRRWTRSQIIDELLAAPTVGDLEVADLAVRALSAEVLLVTYTTHRRGVTGRRSSIWVRTAHDWVVQFHHGTPVAGGDQPRPGPGA
jgi:ribonuclease HI